MPIIYPIIGSTEDQHSYNLKDTSTYKMTWAGSWTHNSTGAAGNGSDTGAYVGGNINFNTISDISVNNWCLGSYNALSSQSISVDFGVVDSGGDPRIQLITSYNGSQIYDPGHQDQRFAGGGSTDGFFVFTRTSSSTYGLDRNGASVTNTTTGANSASSLAAYPLTLGNANYYGTLVASSTNKYSFCFVSQGLTSGEISTLNTIVQANVGNVDTATASSGSEASSRIYVFGDGNTIGSSTFSYIQDVFIQGTGSNVSTNNVSLFGTNITAGTNSYGSYIVGDNVTLNTPNTHLVSKPRAVIQGGSLAVSSTSLFSARATFSSTTAVTGAFQTTGVVNMSGPNTFISNLQQNTNLNQYFA